MSEEIIDYKVDKTGWPEGPWMTEPDRVQWQHAGYACLILRHPFHGFWCGYVGVDRAHALYGKHWNRAADGHKFAELEAHQGVNYTAPCDGLICHVPEPGMPADVWWIGFDCGHTFDVAPGRDARMMDARMMAKMPEDVRDFFGKVERYLTQAYVTRETKRLAEQLRAAAAN